MAANLSSFTSKTRLNISPVPCFAFLFGGGVEKGGVLGFSRETEPIGYMIHPLFSAGDRFQDPPSGRLKPQVLPNPIYAVFPIHTYL